MFVRVGVAVFGLMPMNLRNLTNHMSMLAWLCWM